MPKQSSVILDDKPNTAGLVEFVSSVGHRFYGRANTEDFGVFEYVVDNNEYNLPTHFDRDDIIVDIGAHIGSFSYAVLSRGANKVYAFEAHPQNYAIACKNLLPFADKVVCRNLAVWRSDQPTQTLFNEDITGYIKTGGISVLWNNEGFPVQSISLDEILFEASSGYTNPIKLVKIDCEGAEYPILFTSKQLNIVEEICGEYHEMEPAQIPERARMSGGGFQRFDRYSLKEFFERRGWSIDLEPKSKADGLFHARRMPWASESSDPVEENVDVEKLKESIREAVARRERSGRNSFIKASAELHALLNAEAFSFGELSVSELSGIELPPAAAEQIEPQTGLTLQSGFTPRTDDQYHVNELLIYHDRAFIWNAYRALLKREPDEEGLQSYLERLRSGSSNKIDILASLRYSPEGKRRQVRVNGLIWPAMIRRFYRLPVIGYLAELSVSLI
ncbi:MAG: FkbM family methyltransferase, partial [Pyrinomonadaceae bacterium]